MKKINLLIVSILFASVAMAQVPKLLNYQAIARRAVDNAPMTGKHISVQFTIHNTTSLGTTLYQEHQSVTTNAFGLFSTTVGSGTVDNGSFTSIDWSTGTKKYLEVEVDTTGGTTFISNSSNSVQLVAVPYALQAAKADTAKYAMASSGGYSAGSGINIAGTTISAVDNSATNEIQNLTRSGDTIKLSQSTAVILAQKPITGGAGIAVTNGVVSTVWSKSGANIYNNNTTGKVGVGTTTPKHKLDVRYTPTAQDTILSVINTDTSSATTANTVAVMGYSRPKPGIGWGASFTGGYVGGGNYANNPTTTPYYGYYYGADNEAYDYSYSGNVTASYNRATLGASNTGVYAYAGINSSATSNTGVQGDADVAATSIGIMGTSNGGTVSRGVLGQGQSIGVTGWSINANQPILVTGDPFSNAHTTGILGEVQGTVSSTTYTNIVAAGVEGFNTSTGATYNQGVYGYSTAATSNNYGLYGSANGASTSNYTVGVYGELGTTTSSLGTYAGYFGGDVVVTGNLSKSSGTFKIDHPMDPANKYLIHSFVESPDMMNVYNGNITTDANGFATVTMPSYFSAENKDFRYQLTTIGAFAQVMVVEEISNNQFKIQTDKPNVKVSWQVTGIRQDAWANAHRIVAEEDKKGVEKGKYLHPELFGANQDLSIPAMVGMGNLKTTDKNNEQLKAAYKLPAAPKKPTANGNK